jgi:hypothetical protein
MDVGVAVPQLLSKGMGLEVVIPTDRDNLALSEDKREMEILGSLKDVRSKTTCHLH